jgi:hypothetical protein
MDCTPDENTQASRPIDQIFDDLGALAKSDGAIHGISELIYRDWLYTVDMQEGILVDDDAARWSTSKLNKPELMLLVGLAVQSTSERIHTEIGDPETFMRDADKLLREMQTGIWADAQVSIPSDPRKVKDPSEMIIPLAREAIYYGPESFYLHQFPRFIRERYRQDVEWLLWNKGISIRPMIEIATFISEYVTRQMSVLDAERRNGVEISTGDRTSSFLIPISVLRKKFKGKADSYLQLFAMDVTGGNLDFSDPFALNEVMVKPVLQIGDNLYVPNQYRVFEALYDGPFFWMMCDEEYKDTASINRGRYLERTAAALLGSVFGAENVYENVTLYLGDGKDKAGEIDVLVKYGEFLIVVQAKSKRITMKARAGDRQSLQTDFSRAVQDAYKQALSCAKLLRNGAKCLKSDGTELQFHRITRTFPMVLLSDPFPAIAMLSRSLLERDGQIAPIIWDVSTLDCAIRLLPDPIDLIFFLKSRSDLFDRALAESEHCYLGFHISHKLALGDDVGALVIGRDFSGPVDDFMLPFDVGAEGQRPLGILEKIDLPIVTDLIRALKEKGPELAAVVVDLYDFSSTMLLDLSKQISQTRAAVASGMALKAFTVPTGAGGLTYVVVDNLSEASEEAARAIGRMRKYRAKATHWYLILDCIQTDQPIDRLGAFVWEWERDENEEKNAVKAERTFRSTQLVRVVGAPFDAET